MVLDVRGGIGGSWPPIVRLHGRKAQPQRPNPQLATRALRIGSASNLAAFERGRVWPTLLQTIAQRRGLLSNSCCQSAAVEDVGWVFGTWLIFFGARSAGEGWGPRQIRASCPSLRWRGAHQNPAFSGSSLLRGGLGTGRCTSSAAAQRVPTADCPAIAGLVSHILLRDVLGGRVGRGAGACLLPHQLPNGLLQTSNW